MLPGLLSTPFGRPLQGFLLPPTELCLLHCRELSHLAELRHPNIVPLLAARAHPPDYSLVFPRFRIGSISRAVHELHWLPLASAVLKHASEIASALHHMHSRRLLHRDIKLDNVFLSDVSQPSSVAYPYS